MGGSSCRSSQVTKEQVLSAYVAEAADENCKYQAVNMAPVFVLAAQAVGITLCWRA